MGSVLAALVVAALAPAPARTAPASSAQPLTRLTTLEEQILQRVNGLRRSYGLPTLRTSPGLTAAAVVHTRDMVTRGYFDHDAGRQSTFAQRLERFYGPGDFSVWSVGENLLWATPQPDAPQVISEWMKSPEHRANLLASRWREFGVAVVATPSSGGVFGNLPVTVITADFGVRK